MKDFVIKDFERFLEIADTINTPFKFIQTSESDVGEDYVCVQAKVWMRTVYMSYEEDVKKKEARLDELISTLRRHSFIDAEIRETAFPIK